MSARKKVVWGMHGTSAFLLGLAALIWWRRKQAAPARSLPSPAPAGGPEPLTPAEAVREETQMITAQELVPYITHWEGYREAPYKDSRGIWTVGVGFNLEARGGRLRSAPFNTTAEAVIAGQRRLSRAEIELLLREEIDHALAGAQRLVPNLAQHPKPIQAIVVDMVYNLGEGGFAKFVNTRAALARGDYRAFADGLRNSRWYEQVGRRSRHHVDTVLAVAEGRTLPEVQPA